LAADRLRTNAEARAETEQAANRRELQAKIDLVATNLAAQAAEISDGIARLRATIDDHGEVASEIDRLRKAVNSIRSGGGDPNGKILQMESQISYLVEGRRQSHARVEDFVQRAIEAGKVGDAMSDYEQLCVEDPNLDCSRLTSALKILSKSVDGLDAIVAIERSAFSKFETYGAV
jgi:chromosome segregation ATPase